MNSCSNRSEIVVCGDFNAPEVDWSSFCSPLDTSQMLIDQLDHFQCITKPTHKKGSMLDLCFVSNIDDLDVLDPVPYSLPDHHVLLVEFYIPKPIEVNTPTLKSSLLPDQFPLNLCPITRVARASENLEPIEFFNEFFAMLQDSFSRNSKSRRAKRVKHRFYYSSYSIHLLNKMESLKKKRSRGDTVYQDCVNKRESEFLESVELDKISLLTNLDNCSIADSFKILKLLSSPNPIPSSITWEKTCASNDLAKANLFNHYFASVFSPSCIRENDFIVLAEIKFPEVKLSLENISHALKRCPNSNAVSYDLLPSSLLRKCYECLMPFAYNLF